MHENGTKWYQNGTKFDRIRIVNIDVGIAVVTVKRLERLTSQRDVQCNFYFQILFFSKEISPQILLTLKLKRKLCKHKNSHLKPEANFVNDRAFFFLPNYKTFIPQKNLCKLVIPMRITYICISTPFGVIGRN